MERHPPWFLVMMMIDEDFGALGSFTLWLWAGDDDAPAIPLPAKPTLSSRQKIETRLYREESISIYIQAKTGGFVGR